MLRGILQQPFNKAKLSYEIVNVGEMRVFAPMIRQTYEIGMGSDKAPNFSLMANDFPHEKYN